MKQKKYWLRGGVITVSIFFAFLIVIYWSGQIRIINAYRKVVCPTTPCPEEMLVNVFGNESYVQTSQILMEIVVIIFILFLVGAIFGWFYGKKQNNNS